MAGKTTSRPGKGSKGRNSEYRKAPTGMTPVARGTTVSPRLPPPRRDPNDVVSSMLFNTGPFIADGQPKKVDWWNKDIEPVGRMLIVKAKIWLGVDKGQSCDAHCEVSRIDGSSFALQADHYVDSGHGAAWEMFDFAPYHFAIEPGEALAMTYFANGFGKRFNAHFTLTLWWRWAKL